MHPVYTILEKKAKRNLYDMRAIKHLVIIFLMLISLCSFAQKGKRISKQEGANLTQEQRIVLESNRKSKGSKKDLSMKKRVKIDEKQDKRTRSVRAPKQKAPKRRPNKS